MDLKLQKSLSTTLEDFREHLEEEHLLMTEGMATQEEMKMLETAGNPDSSGDGGGKGFRANRHVSMNISQSQWAKPLPVYGVID